MLTVRGVLDASTYLQVRSLVVKASTDSVTAVVVDIDGVAAPSGSAWAVLTSSSWLIRQWPGIPLLIVSSSADRRAELVRNGVTRYVTVHPTLGCALASVVDERERTSTRLRARFAAPRATPIVAVARREVMHTLNEWGREDYVTCAACVATVLVHNVLRHTDSDLDLRVEAHNDVVTVAVHDGNPAPATIHEAVGPAAPRVSGLAVVSALTRSWGNVCSDVGKTVWAVIGPENCGALDDGA
ncbi:sulfate transporter [Rhodococcoides trifolii]|uniref:Sulfate transporter n=1 Tax=Rhodococcoides trifolii TaxID=908250 RepID=A0A917G6K0_9NOCA|nr:sulfate transporter [Rhodococcus trifolii]GGG25624.1 sulfate transporter [Rhodococcus trifolii]